MNDIIKTSISGAAAAGLLALSAPATAQFYVGGGIGDGTLEGSERFDGGSIDFDESDFAWKLFGGYRFSEYLGVELAYYDLGSPSQNFGFDGGEAGPIDVDLRAELTGIAGHAVVAYPLGPFEVFGKLGVVSYEADLEVKERLSSERFSADDSGTELAYGVGGKYKIDRFALRFEYEIFEANDVDVDIWTFGAELSF
jgi:hypothetical protein